MIKNEQLDNMIVFGLDELKGLGQLEMENLLDSRKVPLENVQEILESIENPISSFYSKEYNRD